MLVRIDWNGENFRFLVVTRQHAHTSGSQDKCHFLGGGGEKMLVWIDSNGLRLEVYQPGHQVESSG